MKLSHQLLEQIISNIPNYIFWKDTDFIYRGCNKNFARLAQLENPDDVIGKSDDELPWGKYTGFIYRQEDQYVVSTGNSINSKTVPVVINLEQEINLSVNKAPLYE